jgi:hypothetical protein
MLFFQEVEMDFHRNAHGKSRSNCFSVPGFLFSLVVLKSFLVNSVYSMSDVETYSRPADDINPDLGVLVARDHFWTPCCILVSSIRQRTICAV